MDRAKDGAPRADGPRPRRRRRPAGYHHGNLRRVLLEVAGELLEADGPVRLSLRAVARRAAVSQTAPYNHFVDKEALLAALAADGFAMLTASMEGAVADAAPEATAGRIRALGRGYIDFALANRERLRLMFGGLVPDMRDYSDLMTDAEAAFATIHTAVAHYMAEGNRGPRGRMGPTTATIAAWSVVHGLASLLADHKIDPANTEAGTEDALIDQVLDVFVDALAARD